MHIHYCVCSFSVSLFLLSLSFSHTHSHIHTRTRIYTHTPSLSPFSSLSLSHSLTHTHTHTHSHTHIHTYTYTHMHTRVHTRTHTHVNICTHTRTRTHTHTHAHKNTKNASENVVEERRRDHLLGCSWSRTFNLGSNHSGCQRRNWCTGHAFFRQPYPRQFFSGQLRPLFLQPRGVECIQSSSLWLLHGRSCGRQRVRSYDVDLRLMCGSASCTWRAGNSLFCYDGWSGSRLLGGFRLFRSACAPPGCIRSITGQ